MMSDETKQLNKARQALVDRVLSRLDEGAIPWDNGMKGFAAPRNAVSGKHYRGMNLLNLMLAGKDDPRWITFNQATDAGYKVKKGAHGVPIELYKTIDKRTGKDADIAAIKEEIKDLTFTERQAFKKENLQTFARTYHVFNASDVIGIEPYRAPTLAPADISARNERIEAVIAGSQAPIFYDGNGRNFYESALDEIHLTNRAAFTSDEFFYNTALHEMAHSTGHSSRLKRKMGNGFGSPEYAREELVAEMASVLIAAEFGLNHSDRVIENSAEYVRSWAKDIRDNPQTLIDASFDASRATDYICDFERQRAQTQEKTQKESVQSSGTWVAERDGKRVIVGEWEKHDISEQSNEPRNNQKEKTQKEKAQPAKQQSAPAATFKTNLDNIPDSMKALPNWVAFRTETLENGKVKKILLSPNKGASSVDYLKWAKADDPTTWATFDKAAAFAKKYNLNGLAFAMSGSGMTCIDLDHHLDEQGKPSELAQKYISAAQGTYIEKSVSGRGLHIFYAGTRPSGHQNRNISLDLETYDSVRFMSMTGNLYENAPKEVAAPSAELTNLLKSNLSKLQQYSAPGTPLGMSDNALIEKIRSSKRGYEFDALWRGEDVAGDHSVSDFKLCNMLAFFSGGDAAQVERCFRASGLYRPEKGDAYVRRTAEKAC
ncbi:MAG: ssDNA-binding domain-containing protein, partial [Clostridiales bacterium]|nr:ssDNA-binding domain-containing protein [Clostridiales bacterium]